MTDDRAVGRPRDGGRPAGWSDAWSVIISFSALGAALAVALDWPVPLRPALVIWFIAICPGMAIIRLLRLDSLLAEVTLAIALSLALAGLIASALVYAGLWSPNLVLEVLVVIAVGALVLGLRGRRGYRLRRS
jgi:uncharacterized membrane protein